MATSPSLLLGYDAAQLLRLAPLERRHLERLSEAWLFSCALLCLPLGHAAWLITHSLLLALLLAAAAFAFLVNLLRLVVAGSGPVHELSARELQQYRPSLLVPSLFAGLALLLASLAVLPFHRSELEPLVERERSSLLLRHSQALQALERPADAAYEESLRKNEFLVLRLRGLWQRPERVVLPGLVFAAIVVLPAFLARFHALEALLAYERARRRQARRAIADDHRRSAEERRALLDPYRNGEVAP